METVDVLVVGAGLAGLRTATLLARLGREVLLVDRRADLGRAVRTTGIFVRRTLEDYPLPPHLLGPPVRDVVLHPPGRRGPVRLTSGRDEFRVADMAGLYRSSAAGAVAAGADLALATRYVGREGGAAVLRGPAGTRRVRARFTVGADGARSAVARDLGLDRTRRVLVGAEEVWAVPPGGDATTPTFHCVLDPRVAPGYVAWVVADGRHAHVGVAGDPRRFPAGLRRALEGFVATAPGLDAAPRPAEVERRAGPIPVGGVLRRIAGPHGLLVGDAAGAVSPLTAGGLDPCLRLSDLAAAVLDDALSAGHPGPLRHHDGAALRRRFRGRLLLRRGLGAVRTPAAAEAAFLLLRTPVGRTAARSVLFGDRSFPDVAPRAGWRAPG